MREKNHQSESQKRVHEYIEKVLVPETKIIFGSQYPGVKPELSCALIVEGGLKIYLRKIDPEQFTSRLGLGKIYYICSQKVSFPKRFRSSVPRINSARVRGVHPGMNGGEITLEEIRFFTKDFLEWIFGKVLKQDIPKDVLVTSVLPKVKPDGNIKEPKKKVDNIRQSPSHNSLQNSANRVRGKNVIQKPRPDDQLKFALTMKSGKKFSRIYLRRK